MSPSGSRRVLLPLLAALCIVLGACATAAPVRFGEDPADYRDRIDELEQRLRRNPNDPEALRDLGIIYLRTSDFARANEFLEAAYTHTPDDPKLIFHLGLVNEVLGRPEAAIRIYEQYTEFPRFSPYRSLTASRHMWIRKRLLDEEVEARLAEEERLREQGRELCTSPADARIVAVYPLGYRGSDERYAPLGRGLAEMITVDLGHVDELRLVERARVQDLLDEMQLASGPAFDPSTAPRVGCLVGAGRLIGGIYSVLEEDVQLDTRLWEASDVDDLGTRSGALQSLFVLEKELVFSLIDRMGIELSPEEREAIESIPTQNLQAFLAYSRGLEREDAGAFDEAAAFYEVALQADPNFQEAAVRSEQVSGISAVSGTTGQAMAAAAAADDDLMELLGLTPTFDAVGQMVQVLGSNLGAGILPGVDRRDPATDAGSSDVLRPAKLPDPPEPPPVGN